MSTLSITVIAANLLCWLALLIPAVLLAMVPVAPIRDAGSSLTHAIYRAAVWIDSAWLERALRIRIVTHGDVPADREARLIVVSNHRTWFDVLVLQHAIVADGPIAKFVIKRELALVPIVGWICLALRFPRLYRGPDEETRRRDLSTVARFALDHVDEPGAIVIFAEGTRFSAEKRDRQASRYSHLLNPRPGGFAALVDRIPGAVVVDATIVYPRGTGSFWRCIDGSLNRVDLWLEHTPAENIDDAGDWLAECWARKEARIEWATRDVKEESI